MTPSGNDDDDGKKDSVESNAKRLIRFLRGNFQKEGKLTCRDCLRTKTLPCPRVVQIADGALVSSASDPHLLEKTHEIILETSTKFNNAPPSSLDCMDQISVALRYLQLVLLLLERKTLQIPNEANLNKMMVSVLKAWTTGVCEWIRNCASNTDTHENCLTADASTSLQPGPVFCFAFYSLLRMNEYVQTRGALMVPLWKGIGELAKLLTKPCPTHTDALSADGDEEQVQAESKDWREALPPNILGDALKVLGDFLQEGKGRLEFEALQHCSNPKGETFSSDRIVFQGKFVGFMATRMAHLLKIYFSFKKSAKDSVLNGVWRSLLGLRGLATTLQLLCSAGIIGNPGGSKIDAGFLKVYSEIAAKAGKCATDTILRKEQNIELPALESLLQSQMVINDKDDILDDNYNRRQEYPEEVQSKLIRISILARTMGKVSMLQQILEIANSRNIARNVEPLLAMIEHMHSISVPQCFSACLIAVRCNANSENNHFTTPTTIVLGSLQIMVRTLQKIEASSDFMASSKRDVFYRLLIRWLAVNSDTENTDKSIDVTTRENPLSRELVVSLIHAHIVNCSDHFQKGRPTKLLSYMTKLVMDSRTGTALRRNIGAVLMRLLSSSETRGGDLACAMATKLVGKEFLSWLNFTAATQKLSKKRKRSRNEKLGGATDFGQQDIMIISRVLSAARGTKEGSLDDKKQVLQKEFALLLSDCSGESSRSEKSFLATAERNSLLLAWLEGCVATRSAAAMDVIREITGLDLLVDILCPVLTTISNLRFKLGQNGDSNKVLKKKVMLYCAAMRLSTAWAVAYPDEGKLPIDNVCLLMKNIISKDPWREPDIESHRLPLVENQHSILKFEVVRLLGFIGKVVPSNCSEKILKVSIC